MCGRGDTGTPPGWSGWNGRGGDWEERAAGGASRIADVEPPTVDGQMDRPT